MQETNRILAQLPRRPALRAALRWIAAAMAGVGSVSVIGALSNAPSVLPEEQRKVVEVLSVPVEANSQDADLPFVREELVRPGDSLRSLVQKLGMESAAAIDDLLASINGGRRLPQLKVGRPATAVLAGSGQLLSLSLPVVGDIERLHVRHSGKGYTVTAEAVAAPLGVEMRSGVITSSLFAATDAADVPDAVAGQLIELFSTEIDFHSDLRRGDRFRVLFQAGYREGRLTSTGRILAAELINQGVTRRVFLFRDAAGREDYYTEAGQSLRQGFLRSPLEFSRVTSGFSLRLHPILNTWRQHQGVDFGAPIGTAVKATGDGTIEFIGQQTGYGNVVVLKHRGGYSTAYAHLNGFTRALGVNASVSQGQVIGYVGQTGWATGPHLHYEFRVAGIPRDPLTVALPAAHPIAPREMAQFRSIIAPLQERLALLVSSAPSSIQ